MYGNANSRLLSGNHAVSHAVRLARPDVIPVYPITPQTPILELITEMHAAGEIKAELLTPESEHSAMSACIPASLTGARVFTATSSQGLLLMHELLHYAAGARTSIVMCNVNRTPASPWGFWPDQLDSLAQRDTGWVQIYSETPQESLDSLFQAYRVAETALVPVMISHDAFYVSHAVEPVDVPSQELADEFLPAFDAGLRLDNDLGRSFGAPLDQNNWNASRRELAAALATVNGLLTDAGREWGDVTGRTYGPLEFYCCEDAEVVIVTMGSMCGTVRDAVDELRESGVKAGMIKVRLLRPLPVEALRDALAGVPCALVLDRNYSPGMGGILHQELKGALFAMADAPRLHGLLAGVGGVNVSPEKIKQLVTDYRDKDPVVGPVWVE